MLEHETTEVEMLKKDLVKIYDACETACKIVAQNHGHDYLLSAFKSDSHLNTCLNTSEEISEELDKIEEISYLASLYNVPEYKITRKIKQGFSLESIDNQLEFCNNLN